MDGTTLAEGITAVHEGGIMSETIHLICRKTIAKHKKRIAQLEHELAEAEQVLAMSNNVISHQIAELAKATANPREGCNGCDAIKRAAELKKQISEVVERAMESLKGCRNDCPPFEIDCTACLRQWIRTGEVKEIEGK
jgi:hypothetical protein